MKYTVEQQVQDLSVVEAAARCLSARVVGEKADALQGFEPDFARIAQYHSGLRVRTVARMFWALATKPQISGFECNEYGRLLPEVKKLIKSKLIRRRKAQAKCLSPQTHRQVCYCGNMARSTASLNQRDETRTPLQVEEARIRRALMGDGR